jgi:hypothetical protein
MERKGPKIPRQLAIKLLREYKRTKGNISHFPDDKRRDIVREICTLIEESQHVNIEPAVQHMKLAGAYRNKQIFLAYLYVHPTQTHPRQARLGTLE